MYLMYLFIINFLSINAFHVRWTANNKNICMDHENKAWQLQYFQEWAVETTMLIADLIVLKDMGRNSTMKIWFL